MIRQWALFLYLLTGTVTDLARGQLPYSSNPPAYDVPPLGIIHQYQRQLEDDVYAVERKAEQLGHRECITGQENFLFCPLVLNIFDYTACIINPATAQGADALIRGIKFPSTAFSNAPSVAVGISGIGTGPTCDVQVQAKDVYASGFNIVINGGFLFYPSFLDVVWIACPVKQPLNTTVRDFVPKKGVPPPPYFPINYVTGAPSTARSDTSNNGDNLIYDDNQPAYDDSKPGKLYEESSVPVDKESVGYEKLPQKSSTFARKAEKESEDTIDSYAPRWSEYRNSTPPYDGHPPARN